MSLIPASVNIELIEVPNEGVVSPGRRSILWVQIDPLILDGLEFCQIVEVSPSLPGVASKKEHAILKRETVSP